MKIMIVGCGSIGRRHLLNLKKLGIRDLILCDVDRARLDKASEEAGVLKKYADFEKAVSENDIDAAIICTPTISHLPIAQFLAENSISMMIEKPLSVDLEGVDLLLSTVKKSDLKLMVAMCYRFHTGLVQLRKLVEQKIIGKIYSVNIQGGYYLPCWHPQSDYRTEYSANKSLGGGVILDSIHALDLMRWIFGEAKEVACFYDKVSELDIDTEDLAAFIFLLRRGIVAEVHLDYLQRLRTNRFEIVGSEGNIFWDYCSNQIKIFRDNTWEEIDYEFQINDMYLSEMHHFINCLKYNRNPSPDGLEGKKTLMLAVAAKESWRSKKFIGLAGNSHTDENRLSC